MERSLFVLVLRIFGLYLICDVLTHFPYAFVSDLRGIVRHPELAACWADIPGNSIPHLIVAWIGACLVLRGGAIARFIAPVTFRRCAHCDYDLNGSHGPVCPECGIPAPIPGAQASMHSLADNPAGPGQWLTRLIPVVIALLVCLVLLKDLADRFREQNAGGAC